MPTVMMHHVTWFLFAWVFANQGGVPVPVVPSLLAAGALAGNGQLELASIFGAAFAASLCADLVWYALGRWRGAEALEWLGRLWREPPDAARRAEDIFLAHQLGFLVSARFVPELNPVAAGLAGAAGVRFARYLLIASGSAVIWVGTWGGVGYMLSGVIDGIPPRAALSLVMVAGIGFTACLALKYARWRSVELSSPVPRTAGASEAQAEPLHHGEPRSRPGGDDG